MIQTKGLKKYYKYYLIITKSNQNIVNQIKSNKLIQT